MKKYYFQHDLTARYDEKISYLCRKYGGIAYGMYWAIVEQLHKEETNKLDFNKRKLDDIATFLKIDVDELIEMIKFAINECELFETDETFFWSNRVLKNIDRMNEIKDARSEAGKASVEAKKLLKQQQKLTNSQQNLTSVENNLTNVEQNLTNSISFNLDLNTNSSNNTNEPTFQKIEPLTFFDCIEKMKTDQKLREDLLFIHRIPVSDFKEYLEIFERLNKTQNERERVEYSDKRLHFINWAGKYKTTFEKNRNIQPQQNNRPSNKTIIIPPK